jgi:nucleoside-diphosphate-sugar epimerase
VNEPNELHVILGANGANGTALTRELLNRGKKVRGINRSGRAPAGTPIEIRRADATDAQSLQEACAGAAGVYNCLNPPFDSWREMVPPIIDATIAGAAAANAKLVFADDTWMYGRVTGPMTEDLPYRPVSNHGTLRALLAEMVLHAHARGTVVAAIGRASELYGPSVRSLLADNIFGAAMSGNKSRWIGKPDVPRRRPTSATLRKCSRPSANATTSPARYGTFRTPNPPRRESSFTTYSTRSTRSRECAS